MTNKEKLDYMIQSLQLAKEEIEFAELYKKEKENDEKFYDWGHFGKENRNSNGTIIRESLKMVGRMANIVANEVKLSSYSDEIFKWEK